MRDTDGTNWAIVRLYVDVQVVAETDNEALYFAACSDEAREMDGVNYLMEIVEPPDTGPVEVSVDSGKSWIRDESNFQWADRRVTP